MKNAPFQTLTDVDEPLASTDINSQLQQEKKLPSDKMY